MKYQKELEELNNNPIFLEMQDMMSEAHAKGEDIKRIDLSELYKDAHDRLLDRMLKHAANPEIKEKICRRVYLKINLNNLIRNM